MSYLVVILPLLHGERINKEYELFSSYLAFAA